MLRVVNRKESQLDPEVPALRPLFDIDSKVPGEPFTPEWMDRIWTFHEERKDLIHLLRGWTAVTSNKFDYVFAWANDGFNFTFCGENISDETRKAIENA